MASFAFIRKNISRYHLDTKEIYVLGCSAGGHLAGCLATVSKNEIQLLKQLSLTKKDIKINGLILCYPVITFKDFAHQRSKMNLIGNDNNLSQLLSLDNRVNKDTSRTFIFHTYNNQSVLLENTLLFCQALKTYNIALELHIYCDGVHGLLCSDITSADINNKNHIKKEVATWVNLCLNWLNK